MTRATLKDSAGRIAIGVLVFLLSITCALSSAVYASSKNPREASDPVRLSNNPGQTTNAVDAIRTTSVMSLDGSFIRAPDQGPTYMVLGGVKHQIMDPRWMQDHSGGKQKIIPLDILNSIPEGAPFSYLSIKDVWPALTMAALILCFFACISRFHNRITRLKLEKIAGQDYGFRVLLFGLLISYVILRSRLLFADPRFWAEEGTIWFQYAVEHSVWATLTYVFYRSGYVNLAANIAAVLSGTVARIGHLLYAPLASTMVALVFQLMPFAVLCFGNSRIFNSRWKLVVAGILLLTLPSAMPEIWLNSINSMSFAGASTLLLLFEENSNWRPATRWAVRVLLVFSGLTGIYCVVLAPFFLACYYFRRSREHAVQGLILLATAAVQGVLVIYFKLHGTLPTRGQAVASLALVNILYYHVMMPFAGQDITRFLFRFFGLEDAWWVATSYPHWPNETTLLAGWVSAILIVAILAWLCRGYDFDKLLLAGIFVMYATVTTLGSLHGIAASRYAFLPAFTMLMLVFSNMEGLRYGAREVACSAAIAMAISVGIMQFYGMQITQGPSWRGEFVKWVKNPSYGLRVWPGWWPDTIYYRPGRP